MAIPDQPNQNDQIESLHDELQDLQKPRKVGTKIGLGVVHDDLQKLNKTIEGKDPKAGRGNLPKISMGGQILDPKNKDEAKIIQMMLAAGHIQPEPEAEPTPEKKSKKTAEEQEPQVPETDEERTARLQKIGEVISEKIGLERGGDLNKTRTDINKSVFETFIEQTKNREELLKDASDEQIKLFKELEDTLVELREANSKDSDELQKKLGELSGKLQTTGDTQAKAGLGRVLQTAQVGARVPTIGGALGAAARGNLLSAGKMLYQTAQNSAERAREESEPGFLRKATASVRYQFGGPQRAERASELGAILKALKDLKPQKSNTTADNKSPSWRKSVTNIDAPSSVLASKGASGFESQPSISIDNIDTLNVKAKNVNIEGFDGGGDFGFPRRPRGFPLGGEPGGGGGPEGEGKKGKPKMRQNKAGRWIYEEGDKKGKFVTAEDMKKYGPKAKPTTTKWGKIKDLGKRFGGKVKGFGAGLLEAGSLAKNVGWGSLLYSSDLNENEEAELAKDKAADEELRKQGLTPTFSNASLPPTVKPVQNQQGQLINNATIANQEVKRTDNKPVVVVPPAPAIAPQINQQSVLLPNADVRAKESSFERYVNRSANY